MFLIKAIYRFAKTMIFGNADDMCYLNSAIYHWHNEGIKKGINYEFQIIMDIGKYIIFEFDVRK